MFIEIRGINMAFMANGKLEVIDYLRGFSIFTIVLMHLVQSFPLPDMMYNATSLGGGRGTYIYSLQWIRVVFISFKEAAKLRFLP